MPASGLAPPICTIPRICLPAELRLACFATRGCPSKPHLHLEGGKAGLGHGAVGHRRGGPRSGSHERLGRRGGDERQGHRSQHLATVVGQAARGSCTRTHARQCQSPAKRAPSAHCPLIHRRHGRRRGVRCPPRRLRTTSACRLPVNMGAEGGRSGHDRQLRLAPSRFRRRGAASRRQVQNRLRTGTSLCPPSPPPRRLSLRYMGAIGEHAS